MTQMNISLPDPIYDWVALQAKQNSFASSNEYVCNLIKEARQHQLMQQAITEGVESGMSERTVADIFKAAKAELKAS